MARRKKENAKSEPANKKRNARPPPKRNKNPAPTSNGGPRSLNANQRVQKRQKKNRSAAPKNAPKAPARFNSRNGQQPAQNGVYRAIVLDDVDMEDDEINSDDDEVFEINQVIGGEAEIMFPMLEALTIYQRLLDAEFRLEFFGNRSRYVEGDMEEDPIDAGPVQEPTAESFSQYTSIFFKVDTEPSTDFQHHHPGLTTADSPRPAFSTNMSEAAPGIRRASVSSNASYIPLDVPEPKSETSIKAQSYVFDFGAHRGKKFTEVPEYYLRTIASQQHLFNGRHPGLKEAFDYFRPGLRSNGPNQQKKPNGNGLQAQPKQPIRQTSNGNIISSLDPALENYTFPRGAHKGKKMDEVDENYLSMLENKKHIIDRWPGLKDAFRYYNRKTGRKGRF